MWRCALCGLRAALQREIHNLKPLPILRPGVCRLAVLNEQAYWGECVKEACI